METFSALLAFVPWIHRSPVNFPHKGQWRRALMFSLICTWINGWVNNREAGDLRRHRGHYDVTVMYKVNVYLMYKVSKSLLNFIELEHADWRPFMRLKYTTFTETKMSSFWRNFHHWLHWKLSFWQLPVQPVMNISSKWRLFRFSVVPESCTFLFQKWLKKYKYSLLFLQNTSSCKDLNSIKADEAINNKLLNQRN